MRNKLPFVSIVIPLYNSTSFLRRCLDSVLKTKYPSFEIILVDDMSTDDTVGIVTKEYSLHKNIHLIKNEKKLLAAGSRNVGFHHSKGEFIALLDHDVEVDPLWVKEMVAVAASDSSIGIVQSKIYDYKKRKTLQCVGVKIYPQLCWVSSVGQGIQEKKSAILNQEVVGAATGVLYAKKAFLRSGRFDERLGINLDDLDLNWRMWIVGYKTVVAPKAITYHWSKTQKTRDAWLNRFRWEFHYAKVPRVFIKNYSLINILHYLPMYIIVANIRGIFNILFRFNFAPLVGFWSSFMWNLYYFPDTLRERSKIQEMRKFSDTDLAPRIFINKNLFVIFVKYWFPIIKIGKNLARENMN